MSRILTEKAPETGTKQYLRKEGCWHYIPAAREAEEGITPQKAAGDIGYPWKKKPEAVLLGTGGEAPVSPFRAKLGYSQKVLGYIPCEDEEGALVYVRVIGRSWLRLLLPLLLLLAVITGGLWWYFTLSSVPDLEDSAIAYQMPNGLKNEDPSQIMIPGISGFTLEEGGTRIEHVLYNPEGNPCYFKYRIMLRDTQEVLYESGLVKPGTAIMEFDLNRTLEAGSYDVTVLVETTSVEDPEAEMNRGAVNTTITVE